ncbi:unnamed protein product [Allacma fusca]|uniref:Uncharacterized protein n=1 Tax=Allacma fusca TaxID=39272 RepID=A0A8J2JPM7_9HEXA|nr:unnamed protein product [Allacma fusca]
MFLRRTGPVISVLLLRILLFNSLDTSMAVVTKCYNGCGLYRPCGPEDVVACDGHITCRYSHFAYGRFQAVCCDMYEEGCGEPGRDGAKRCNCETDLCNIRTDKYIVPPGPPLIKCYQSLFSTWEKCLL